MLDYDWLLTRRISRLKLGDAIYRTDQNGFGWRLEYIDVDLLEMEYKYILFYRTQAIGKVDVRSNLTLPDAQITVTKALTYYGFTIDNTRIIHAGALTLYNESFSRVPALHANDF
jgi:hypothetical protein